MREPIAIAHRNSLRLLKLVNTLLDFSRIEAGRVEALYEPTNLPAFTAELASVFRSAIEKAGMRLIVDCARIEEPVYVDRDMWEKIVLNLVSNAFKYTLAGEIRVSMRRQGEHAQLVVADTGTGIPEDALPRLFERFYRVPQARGRTQRGHRHRPGTGATSWSSCMAVPSSVASRIGQGTTFTLNDPVRYRTSAIRAESKARVRLSSTAVAANAFVEEAMRWLDADSPAETAGAVMEAATTHARDGRSRRATAHRARGRQRRHAQLCVAVCSSERYQVEAVADGALALQAHAARATRARHLRHHDAESGRLRPAERDSRRSRLAGLPVIFLSARAGEEATVEGIAAGADDYLVKPFSARELLVRVAAQIERKRFEKALHQTEERLKIALKNAPLVLYTIDRDLRYTWIHRAPMDFNATVLLGRRDDELALYHDAQELADLERSVLDTSQGVRKEIWLQADGQRKAYDMTIEPLRNESNEVIGLTVAGVDVTQSRMLVAERERLLEGRASRPRRSRTHQPHER